MHAAGGAVGSGRQCRRSAGSAGAAAAGCALRPRTAALLPGKPAPAPCPAELGVSAPTRPWLLQVQDGGAQIWEVLLLLQPPAPSLCAQLAPSPWQPLRCSLVCPAAPAWGCGRQAALPGPAKLPGTPLGLFPLRLRFLAWFSQPWGAGVLLFLFLLLLQTALWGRS